MNFLLWIFQHEEQTSRSRAITDVDVIVVCYSAVDRESFENVKSYWVPEIRKLNKKKPVVLVATQSDIRDENNSDHVSDTEGQNLMKLINADYYNTCSAATNDGIKKVFESVILATIRYRKKKTNVLKRVFGRWTWTYLCPEMKKWTKCIAVWYMQNKSS